jgi:hypothetical protein
VDGLFLIAGVSLFLIVVVPLWALARTRKLKRESATKDEVAYLTQRVFGLEQSVEKLRKALEATPASGVAAKPAQPPTAPAPPPKLTIVPAPAPPTTPPAIITPLKPSLEPKPVTPAFVAATQAKTAPQFETVEAPPKRDWTDIEEKLGANWLNKIGVAVLILGGAFLANYAMQTLGPAGKAALLYVLAAALIGLGVFGEKKEKYRVGARGVLGGGWALAYFTTYAVHNVEAVQLIKSPAVGFGLLFAVAAAMVWHSLRYNSQVVTGFAYMLAFASVAVSRITMGTLVSSAVLAASLVAVLARRKWYVLELPAIAATYGVHWFFLWRTYEYIGGQKKFPDYSASVALLIAYWVIFTVSHFLRDDKEPAQRLTLTGAFLLNVAGFLAVMRYQSFYPQWRFWFLLGVGVVYLALAALSRRMGRRLGFVLTSTLGAALVVVAIPYRFAGARLELIWLVEAEALLIIGWRAADVHLRRLGWSALGVLATYVMFHDMSPRLVNWTPPDWPTGWMLLVLAAAFYLNARYAPRLLGEDATETELAAATICYGAGTGFLLAAVWFALPFMWVALVWTALALLVCEAGRGMDEKPLGMCGHGAALLAAVRLLVINLQYRPAIYGVSLQVVTVALSAALFYIGARRILPNEWGEQSGEETGGFSKALLRWLPGAYSWMGTSLLAVMVWNEVTNAAVGLAWGLLALALVEVGRTLPDWALVAQGHTLLVLSFARIFFADLNTEKSLWFVSARLVTVTMLAAIYYYTGYTAEARTPRMRTALMWFGTTALLAMLRFELIAEWVAVAWAVLAVTLYFAGRKLELPMLNHQAYVVTLLVGVRCAFDNFYQTGPLWFTNTRTVTVTLAAAMMYALLTLALIEKRKAAKDGAQEVMPALAESKWRVIRWIQRGFGWMDANPQQLYFFVPTVLLTVLLSLEMSRNYRSYLTASWGLEAFLIFVVALKLGERMFRWFSLGLLLLCVVRVVAVDIPGIENPLGRIVSLMGLGAALLLVSFLYARNKELFRKYL